jgi:hypothetical protein
MTIRVLFDNYTPEQLQAVCDYYNKDKPDYWERLEILDRMEGCFKIQMHRDNMEEEVVQQLEQGNHVNENKTHKQIRWDKKCLVTPVRLYRFSKQELHLLYLCMARVFGEDMILYEDHGKN